MLICNDILWRVALALLEPCVNTTSTATIAAGVRNITPVSMSAIYSGCQLIFDRNGVNEEVITVSSIISSTTFQATFTKSHSGTQTIMGATFPSGNNTPKRLFTQAEMLGYLAQSQNDLLLRLRPIYTSGTKSLTLNTQTFAQPTDCIRLERMSVAGAHIPDTSQAYLDLSNPAWMVAATKAAPDGWFQDKLDTGNFGIHPTLAGTVNSKLYYSQKAATSLALNDSLLSLDIFSQYLKWSVLAMALAKDGEQRDPKRSSYCYGRYTAGLEICSRFLEGMGVQPQKNG